MTGNSFWDIFVVTLMFLSFVLTAGVGCIVIAIGEIIEKRKKQIKRSVRNGHIKI